MLRALLLTAAVLTFVHAKSQSLRIAQAEYFFGADPGVGLGTAMEVTDGQWDQAIESLISSIDAGAEGDQVLSIRVKGANGSWSNVYRLALHVGGVPSTRQVTITQGEYFWDNDPGAGNATPVITSSGASGAVLQQVIGSANAMPVGPHRLGVRVKSADGTWSATFSHVVSLGSTQPTRDVHVRTGEFFFDSDPGEGSGNALVAINGNWNEALQAALGATATPAEGTHLLSLRLRGDSGVWSGVFRSVIHIGAGPIDRTVRLQSGECFLDADPGVGNGTPLVAAGGDWSAAIATGLASLPSPPVGDHLLSIRVRGIDGSWSGPIRSVLHIASVGEIRDPHVRVMELFVDADPGEGNATTIPALDGNWNDALEAGIMALPPLPPGDHLLNVRVRGDGGSWSTPFRTAMHVGPVQSRADAVTDAEYWWDSDPGAGNAQPLQSADGSFSRELERAITTATSGGMSSGPHVLGVRMRGADGVWSTAFRQVVLIPTVPDQALPLTLAAFLQGPLLNSTTMSDALRTVGTIPLTEPFTALGFTHVGSGGETIDPSALDNAMYGNVVDWIFVELRAKDHPESVVRTRCGLLLQNGAIVSTDLGTMNFTAPPGDYYVSVRHRNHLAVMTRAPLAMSSAGASLDLRLISTPTYGNAARTSLFGRAALWSGDTNGDGTLKYTGAGNDRDPVLLVVGGTTPNNVVSEVYDPRDVNMDGQVKYTGAANDRDPILVNVGGTNPNNVRSAQVP